MVRTDAETSEVHNASVSCIPTGDEEGLEAFEYGRPVSTIAGIDFEQEPLHTITENNVSPAGSVREDSCVSEICNIIPPPEEFRDAVKWTCDSPEMETSISMNNDSCDSGFLSDAEDLTADALEYAVPFPLKTPSMPKNRIKIGTAPVLLTILEIIFSLCAFLGSATDVRLATSYTDGDYPMLVRLGTKFETEVNDFQNYHGCLGCVKLKKIPPNKNIMTEANLEYTHRLNSSVAVYLRCGVSPVALTVPGWSPESCVPRDKQVPRVRFEPLGTILQQNRNKVNTNNSNPLFHSPPPELVL